MVMARLWVVIAVLGIAAPAVAQREVAIDRLEPAFDRHGFIGIQGTRAPGPLQLDAALWMGWSRSLLELRGRPETIVDHRLSSNAMIQLGLGGRFALGLDIPLVLYQSGDRHGLDEQGALTRFAGGDPRLVFRARLLGEEATEEPPERAEGFGLAALASVSAPLGADRGFVGEASSVTHLQLLADFHVLGLGVGAFLGWRHRFQHEVLGSVVFRDELQFGLGLEVPLPFGKGWSSLLEVRGWTDARSPFGDSARTGVVGDWGVRWRKGDYTLTASIGTGLTSGIGTPRFRGLVGVMWSPRVHDADGDGIPDHLDQCPHVPEDFDGFEDEDGCMDPDNDGDGIPDTDDQCPDEPEDFDGFEDEDGCPDPDNDGDGIPDEDDACPDVAGIPELDGCPEAPEPEEDGLPGPEEPGEASGDGGRDGPEAPEPEEVALPDADEPEREPGEPPEPAQVPPVDGGP
jgi:OmpA-OmpF porin, OOP family